MEPEDIVKVRRWFESGERSPKLLQLLMDHRPSARCEVAAAMRVCRSSRPLVSDPFERRRVQSHFDLTRRVVGPTTADFYGDL